ncbi:MAG: hypothetical protein ACR2GT_12285 [Gaiellaceae bacterium]
MARWIVLRPHPDEVADGVERRPFDPAEGELAFLRRPVEGVVGENVDGYRPVVEKCW